MPKEKNQQKKGLSKIKWLLLHGHEPETTNLPVLTNCLNQLLQKKSTHYESRNTSEKVKNQNKEIKASEVIIIEGHRAFQHQEINKIADLKVYVDADDDLRLMRMIERDPWLNKMVGREIKEVWVDSVKVPHKKYVLPTKKHADLVLFNNEQSDLEKNVQSITSLIDLYFQNQSEFKTKLEKIERKMTNQQNLKEKAKPPTKTNHALWISLGLGVMALLGIIGYFLFKKKKG